MSEETCGVATQEVRLPEIREVLVPLEEGSCNVALAGPEDGTIVVLLHGFPETWWTWRYQIGALVDAGYRVVAQDLRGSGKSTVRGQFGLDQLTEDAVAIIEWATSSSAGEPVLLLGHDWGGTTAWQVARAAASHVRALAVVNACLPERLIEALSTKPSPRQILSSLYVFAFQILMLPDHLLTAREAELVSTIIRAGIADQDNPAFDDVELAPLLSVPRTAPMRGMWSHGDRQDHRESAR